MKTKKIPTLIFSDGDSGEGPECYNLRSNGDAMRFFQNLEDNIERGTTCAVIVEDWTKAQWKRAREAGDFIGGIMSEKRSDKYIANIKRRQKRRENKNADSNLQRTR